MLRKSLTLLAVAPLLLAPHKAEAHHHGFGLGVVTGALGAAALGTILNRPSFGPSFGPGYYGPPAMIGGYYPPPVVVPPPYYPPSVVYPRPVVPVVPYTPTTIYPPPYNPYGPPLSGTYTYMPPY